MKKYKLRPTLGLLNCIVSMFFTSMVFADVLIDTAKTKPLLAPSFIKAFNEGSRNGVLSYLKNNLTTDTIKRYGIDAHAGGGRGVVVKGYSLRGQGSIRPLLPRLQIL